MERMPRRPMALVETSATVFEIAEPGDFAGANEGAEDASGGVFAEDFAGGEEGGPGAIAGDEVAVGAVVETSGGRRRCR